MPVIAGVAIVFMSPIWAKKMSVPERLAPESIGPSKVAPDRSAPDRLAHDRFMSDTSIPDRSVPDKLALLPPFFPPHHNTWLARIFSSFSPVIFLIIVLPFVYPSSVPYLLHSIPFSLSDF